MTGQCCGQTASGQPCRNWRVNAAGLCWRHDGRPSPECRPRKASDAPKICIVCGRARPARCFGVGATNHNTRVAYRKRTCLDCEERARRIAGIPKRHQRYNARGDVWCNNCKRYRARTEFRRHPLRPHTFWSYCKECTRVLDRMRYRAKAKTPEGKEAQRTRIQRRARRRRGEQAERARFVQDAIGLLLRRGLTKTEICRLASVSFGNLLKWERRESRVSPAVAERLVALLLATAGLTIGTEPAFRRRKPHPELPRLMAHMGPVIEAHPVRSRWGNRR